MDMEKLGGLLGMLGQEQSEEPFYVVGKRPLNFHNLGDSIRRGSPSMVHEHFIGNDGIRNFGFTDTGEFSEAPQDLLVYEPSKYGMKKYKAGLLDMARENWHSRNESLDQVVEELGLQDEVDPRLYKEYSFDLNNCQDYVEWLDQEYNRLFTRR